MRLIRLSTVALLAVCLLLLGYAATAVAAPSAAARTYTVMVGAESVHRGIDVMAYFPGTVKIHVGDTVRWRQNSNEIHTVTLLGDTTVAPPLLLPATALTPPSPLVFNPMAVFPMVPTDNKLGDTNMFVNSGLMGREAGQAHSFDLTFTAVGTYPYLCLVHGAMMSGTVEVVGRAVHIASPGQVHARGNHQIARQMAQAPAVVREAKHKIVPATKNADGTSTHYVAVGYSSSNGKIDLMRFFPSKLRVRPGDTVKWALSSADVAPHTVTFLNGLAEPGLIDPVGGVLYINRAVFFPSSFTPTPLTRSGMYNSGLLDPTGGGPTGYSWVIGHIKAGPLPYLCMLHDTSGMRGTLIVLPK